MQTINSLIYRLERVEARWKIKKFVIAAASAAVGGVRVCAENIFAECVALDVSESNQLVYQVWNVRELQREWHSRRFQF